MNPFIRPSAILLIMLFLLPATLEAQNNAPESDALQVLKPKVEQTLSILQNSNLSRSEKRSKIEDTVEDLFNYRLMGKLALGRRYWDEMNAEQKEQYVELLKQTLKFSYFQKMDEVSGVRISYEEPVQKGANKVYVPTTVEFQNEDLTVEYRMYRSDADRPWSVFDVVVKGVSIVKSYRSQYSDYLNDHSISELLQRMREKIEELRNQDKSESSR